VLTILGALNYAELASVFPSTGGQYVYLKEIYGKLVGFLFVWTSFFVIQTGTIAAVAIAMAKYIGTFLPFISEQNVILSLGYLKINSAQIVGILSVIVLTIINLIGLKWGALVQNIFTILKVLVVVILIIFSFSFSGGGNLFSSHSVDLDFSNLNLVLGVFAWSLSKVFFAYDAWYYLTYISGEVKDPSRNVPLGMVLGVTITTIVYCLVTMGYLYVLGIDGVAKAFDNKVAEEVSKLLFPAFGVYFISLGIIISTFGCNNGLIMTGARLVYALALDRMFFSSFAKEHPTFKTPHLALIFQSFWIIFLILIGNYSSLLTYVTFISIGFNFLTILGVIILRIKRPSLERGYKAWFYPFSTLAYLLLTLVFLVYTFLSSFWETLAGLFILLTGVLGYFLFAKKNEKNIDNIQ